jgi:hypothetical protein
MFTNAFCQENSLRDERHVRCRSAVPPRLELPRARNVEAEK